MGKKKDVIGMATKSSRDGTARGRGRIGGAVTANQVNWLARELHDGVLQDLLYFGLELPSLMEIIPEELTEVRERLQVLDQLAREDYDKLRLTLDVVRTRGKARHTLSEALREQTELFTVKTKVAATLEAKGECAGLLVAYPVCYHVSAIVREALWNAWKHGKAHQVGVVIQQEAEGVEVRVEDDGQGFDPSAARDGHYGLNIMQERADAIGARLQLTTAPGQGAEVKVCLPVVESVR